MEDKQTGTPKPAQKGLGEKKFFPSQKKGMGGLVVGKKLCFCANCNSWHILKKGEPFIPCPK